MSKKKTSSQAVLIAVILLCLVAVAACAIVGNTGKDPAPPATDTQTASDVTDTATDRSEPTTQLPVTDTSTGSGTTSSDVHTNADTDTNTTERKPYVSANETSSFDKSLWYMKLVNPDNGIDQAFIDSVEMTTVRSNGRDWKVDARCAADMKAMIDAAKADGVELIICSAFRSIEKQTTNFNNYVDTIMSENPSWTREEAVEYTTHVIAVPGTSEHHTGLAADIVTPSYQRLNSGFAKTAAFRWLYAHCAEYGFVMRYPEDKQDITKIIYEPWHYRYVGKEAATIMMNEGICFEEFLEKYGTEQ